MELQRFKKHDSVFIMNSYEQGVIVKKVRGKDEYDVWVTMSHWVAIPGQTFRGPNSDIRRFHASQLRRIS